MKRLAAWAAIVAVPTLIAGIYGMNFESMPELDWNARLPDVARPDVRGVRLPRLSLPQGRVVVDRLARRVR